MSEHPLPPPPPPPPGEQSGQPYQPQPYAQPQPYPQPPTRPKPCGLSIAGFVIGVAAIPTFAFAWTLGIAPATGLVLSIIGYRRDAAAVPARSTTMAIWGIVLSAIGTAPAAGIALWIAIAAITGAGT